VQPLTPVSNEQPLPLTTESASTPTTIPPTTVSREAVPPPEHVLFIGDSTVSWGLIDQHLEKMAAVSDPPLRLDTRTSIYGGGSLEIQWDTGLALKEVRKGGWDAVVLQENSGVIGDDHTDDFYEYAHRFDQEVKGTDAYTVLLMDWEYPRGDWDDTDKIVDAHRRIAEELGAKVAPVGLAWKRAVEERPDLNLYDYDNIHSNNLGTYLTLVVIYATLFDLSPIGQEYRLEDFVPHPDTVPSSSKEMAQQMRDELFVADEDAEFLQRIAWETIQEWLAY
jgi:hypothetical protein